MGYEDVLRSLKVRDQLYVGNSISGNGLMNTAGTVWYVNSNLSASGSGRSWETAFLTLLEAVTAADDYDTILIAPASIQTIATAGITITQTGLRIFGANANWGLQASALKKSVGATPMFIISADRVEIAGLCLSMRTAAVCIQIGTVANSGGGIYQTYIHDCNIEGQTGTIGIAPYDATVDPVNLVVKNNFFRGFTTTAIEANGTRDAYIGNYIVVAANDIGITYVKDGADRAYGIIADNYIVGAKSGDTGISFSGTPTAGTLMCVNNYVQNCNTPITQGKGDENFCMNYISNSTGGATFDPSV